MRIIAGEKRARKLFTLEGLDTRPTADRVKESLFNILTPRLRDASVLDLYAGSGALALEALSRGAALAHLSDASPDACRVIKRNVELLSYSDRAFVHQMTDEWAIPFLKTQKGCPFDLIFLDPPYKMDAGPVMAKIVAQGLLAPDGLIVVEHHRDTPPSPVDALIMTDCRFYGITGLSFFKKAGENT